MPSYPDLPSLQGDRPAGLRAGRGESAEQVGGVCVCSEWVVHSLTAIPEKSRGPSAWEPDTAALSPGLLSRLLEGGSCAGCSLHNSRSRAPSLA